MYTYILYICIYIYVHTLYSRKPFHACSICLCTYAYITSIHTCNIRMNRMGQEFPNSKVSYMEVFKNYEDRSNVKAHA